MNKLAKPEISWLRTYPTAQTHQVEVDGGGVGAASSLIFLVGAGISFSPSPPQKKSCI